jgi:putative endonuclease
MMIWSIYMVRDRDNKIYTGISTDVTRRFNEHQGTGTKGAKFLRGRGPLELLVVKPVGKRSDALRVEHRVKRLRKSRKEDIAREPDLMTSLILNEVEKCRSQTCAGEQ